MKSNSIKTQTTIYFLRIIDKMDKFIIIYIQLSSKLTTVGNSIRSL